MIQGLLKLLILYAKRSRVVDLVERIRSTFWKMEDVKDIEERKVYEKTLFFLSMVSKFCICTCVLTTMSYTCRTFVLGGQLLPYYTYRPPWLNFYILLFYEGMVFVCGQLIPIVGLDFLILALLMLTQMQFKILNQELRKTFLRKGQVLRRKDQDIVEARIKKCVEHHIFLLDFVDRFNSTFSEVMLLYLALVIGSMCFEMYIISTQNSVKAAVEAVIYTVTTVFQYILCYCFPGQAVTDEADKIYNSAYFSNWYEYTENPIKKSIMMIIAMGQKRIHVTAGGIVIINMETCLKTIQTMVSYCMFLRTMGIDGN